MPTAAIAGVQLAWEAAGEGPAMVLLHPNPFDHAIWQYQMARFSFWFHVVAPDFPGYGRSARVPWPSIRAVSDQVAGLLDHLGIAQAVVVGLSVGGIVAQEFAVDHPDRVRALVVGAARRRGRRPAGSWTRGSRATRRATSPTTTCSTCAS
jgi:pimeloyl-ACP methyl ester carboxylesterase